MKKILISLFIILSSSILCQDFEPGKSKFFWGTGDIIGRYLTSDSSYFKQRNFLLGWHWVGTKKISPQSNALRGMNALNALRSCVYCTQSVGLGIIIILFAFALN